jgi:predicted alpha/beta-fold hydrolase
MLGITEKALALGMNVIRYNQRNCGGTDALAPVLYHSGLSNDVAVVAREVIARDGVSRLALVGFSMGGNLVLKLAGEWGSQAPPCISLQTESTKHTSCGRCTGGCCRRRGCFPITSTSAG